MNALILHGTDSNPEENWFPWLKRQLEDRGYNVWVPSLPENHTPNRTVYNDFLFSSEFDFKNSLMIGHSSGAVSVLNMLMDNRCPHIKQGIMVSAWAGGIPNGYGENNTQFDNLFPANGFDFELMKSKAESLSFVHSGNDPYCPLGQAEYLASKLGASLTVIQDGGHLGQQFTELPQVPDAIS